MYTYAQISTKNSSEKYYTVISTLNVDTIPSDVETTISNPIQSQIMSVSAVKQFSREEKKTYEDRVVAVYI